ncbi:extracellular solute-binding protein [Aeromicrobium wangtongii]|uniref:extracellular solute-binding protein n=1 Tax=Aeromicrobium wangtongii TaxID=2969247 RepID=UPI0020173435|nr:extracellular solute-binding protein [Aeromicrobium wangtongii]MCL3816959.1 extracellular solute-binding protein [Aeromicrobium wangtongii]
MVRKKLIAQVAAAGLVAVVAAGCGSDSSGSSDNATITYVGYGGDTQTGQVTAWQEPFTKDTGTKFQNDTPPDMAKLRAMVESGNVSWDVIGAAAAEGRKYCGELFEPLTDADIDPGVYNGASKEQIGDCGLPVFEAPAIPFYNTDDFGDNPPTTIADVFDTKKYPGKRIFLPFVTAGTLEVALLADGVEPDALYPLDIDRALAKLDTLGKDAIIPANYGELQQAMASGNVAMAFSTPSRASFTIADGAPYAPVWDKVVTSVSIVGIPKGAKNMAAAKKWASYISKKEPQARAAEITTLPPANSDSQPKYDELQESLNAYSDEHKGSLVYMDVAWWAENQEEVQTRFTKWQVG